jgi:hypothetical protein
MVMSWSSRRRIAEEFENAPRVKVAVPEKDVHGNIARHQDGYDSAVAAMSPSRTYGAEFSSTSFRRLLTGVDPSHDNGWAFQGLELPAGEEAEVPVGGIILVLDRSFAKGNWYASRQVDTSTVVATLLEVTQEGLKEVLQDTTRGWARKMTGWLVSQRPDLPQVSVKPPRR